MARDYAGDIIRMNNEYRALINKAEMLRISNMDAPSKQEGYLYQQAADICGQLATKSIGAEKEFWMQKQKECTAKIREIVMVLNPRAIERADQKKKEAAKAKAEGKATGKTAEDKSGTGSASASDDVVTEAMVQSWYKNQPKHGFDKVAGMKIVKDRLEDSVKDAGMSALNKFLEMDSVQSFFFYGLPGCGKTYIIEAFANELMKQGYKYLSLSGGDILSRYVGDAEKIVARLFEEAEKIAPCIIFIDEIDGVCRNRSLPNLPEYAASITTSFLTGYNSICETDKSIIFMSATNYPHRVDDAMLDRVERVRIPLPDAEARAHNFKLKLQDIIAQPEDFSYEDMAELTENFNYRDIKHLIDRLKRVIKKELCERYKSDQDAVEALKDKRFELNREIFMKAYDGYSPSLKEDIERKLNEWEEQLNQREED